MRLYLKPTGHWAVDFEDAATGKRRRVSTGLRDKAEARRKARDIVMGLAGTPAPTPASPKAPAGPTMDDLWRRCELTVWSPREARSQKTIKSNLRVLRALVVDGQRLADMEPGSLTYSVLERTTQALLAVGYAPGTVKRKMDMVGKSLTMATRWEIMVARPAMPTLKVENKRERVMTDEEEAAIFQACAKRAEAEPARPWVRFGHLVRFLLDVGCRLGEALNVKLGDVEEIDGQWVVHFRRYETKNGKPRSIPLTDAVVASLPYLRMTAARGMIFPITAGTAWYMWDNLREDVGDMEDVVLHTLRHTCITRLAARLPIQIVSLWAGHSDIKVTAGYTHLNTSNLVQAMQVLNTGR